MSEERASKAREYPVTLEIRQDPGFGGIVSHFVNGQRVSRGDYVRLVQDLCYRVAREQTLIVTIKEALPASTNEETRKTIISVDPATPDSEPMIFEEKPGEGGVLYLQSTPNIEKQRENLLRYERSKHYTNYQRFQRGIF